MWYANVLFRISNKNKIKFPKSDYSQKYKCGEPYLKSNFWLLFYFCKISGEKNARK